MNGNSSTTTSFDRFPVATDELDRGPSTGQRMGWYANAAARLAVQSAGDALENAGVGATAVTHLVTASCTGFEAPGVDVGLIDALGLDADVARTNIGFMGCHAALNALRVARAFVEADPQACVLVCAGKSVV